MAGSRQQTVARRPELGALATHPVDGAAGGGPPLSRLCALADWRDAALVGLMDAIVPGGTAARRPHRKSWEFALGVRALEAGGALHEAAFGLSVGAGHEPVLYYLTNRCRWLFATDLYGFGDFVEGESSGRMLVDPDLFAPYPYRSRRLTVAYMDALDLRFEDGSFDFAVSFGSIEHFGGIEAAATALGEIARVLKPGGVAFITTEVAADGRGDGEAPLFHIFSPETLLRLVAEERRLDWLGDVDLAVPDDSDAPVVDLFREVMLHNAADQTYPHTRLRVETDDGTRLFTSASLALVRVADA